MIIDKQTGLPQLPDGFEWRITEWRDYFKEHPPTLSIAIYGPETVEETVERAVHSTWWKFWQSSKWVEETVNTTRMARIHGGLLRETKEVRDISPEDRKLNWLPRIDKETDEDRIATRVLEPTRENILRIASIVYGYYERDKEEQDRLRRQAEDRKKFIGVYPPKTL